MPDEPRSTLEGAGFGPALIRLVEQLGRVEARPEALIQLLQEELDRHLGPHRSVLACLEGEPPALVVRACSGSGLPPGEQLVARGEEQVLAQLRQGRRRVLEGGEVGGEVELRLAIPAGERAVVLPLLGALEAQGAWVVAGAASRLVEPAVLRFLDLLAGMLGPLVAWTRLRSGISASYGTLPQHERLAELGRLVAGVAHELGSPLQSIISHAELLEREPERADPLEGARRILRAAMRCRGIVQELLNFARKDAERQRPILLPDVLLDALELERFSDVGEIHVRIEGENEPPPVLADQGRLSQVILNLINNARQAVKDSGKPALVTVTLETVPAGASRLSLPEGDAVVRVRVQDQGPGVPAALQERIFDPFFTTKEVGEGSGLGLSISRSLVASMGGLLYLDASRSPGACFVVELPAASGAATPAAGSADDADEAPAPCRILLVDDDRDVLETYEAILGLDGHQVKGCDRGGKALEALANDPFDVVICDIRLPDLSGPRFLDALREAYPAMARRVIFATGDVINENTRAFLSATTCPVLIKPFRIEDLYRAMRQVL